MNRDHNRAAADVAVFDVLDGFVRGLGFDDEGFGAVGAGDRN